jgi:hemerythrin
MAYLHWTKDLDTGIDDIDKQHRRIVDYINELNEANDAGELAATEHVLNKLVDYARNHFTAEEELLKKADYPYLKAHKRLHEMFIKRIAEFQHRVSSGENVIPELHSMLKTWLVNHIKGDDALYVESVNNSLGLG